MRPVDDPVTRRVLAALREHRPLAPEDARQLIPEILSGKIGETGRMRRHRRDAILRELGACQEGTTRSIARTVAADLARYAAIAFPNDKAVGKRPDGARGLLFDILELNDGRTLSFASIRVILRAG